MKISRSLQTLSIDPLQTIFCLVHHGSSWERNVPFGDENGNPLSKTIEIDEAKGDGTFVGWQNGNSVVGGNQNGRVFEKFLCLWSWRYCEKRWIILSLDPREDVWMFLILSDGGSVLLTDYYDRPVLFLAGISSWVSLAWIAASRIKRMLVTIYYNKCFDWKIVANVFMVDYKRRI